MLTTGSILGRGTSFRTRKRNLRRTSRLVARTTSPQLDLTWTGGVLASGSYPSLPDPTNFAPSLPDPTNFAPCADPPPPEPFPPFRQSHALRPPPTPPPPARPHGSLLRPGPRGIPLPHKPLTPPPNQGVPAHIHALAPTRSDPEALPTPNYSRPHTQPRPRRLYCPTSAGWCSVF